MDESKVISSKKRILQSENAYREENPKIKQKKHDDKRIEKDEDEISGALEKISNHILNPSKYKKAAILLIKLFENKNVAVQHSNLAFKAIHNAMLDEVIFMSKENKKLSWKLISTVCSYAHIFNNNQKCQLDVYQIWVILKSELMTDDSFFFSKRINKIKKFIDEMPSLTEYDEEIYKQWKEKIEKHKEVLIRDKNDNTTKKITSTSTSTSTSNSSNNDDEDMIMNDPFGLEEMMDISKISNEIVWSKKECLMARREALMRCLDVAYGRYTVPWAATTIDICIKHFYDSREKFCEDDRNKIEEIWTTSQKRKMIRFRRNDASFETDINWFDKARHAWSQAKVSHRGKVGAEGDHKAETWLG